MKGKLDVRFTNKKKKSKNCRGKNLSVVATETGSCVPEPQ